MTSARLRIVPVRLRQPLRSPSFRHLALGKASSYLGDWLMVAALIGWVYQSSASLVQVATLMAIRLVPPILGGGLAASLVDRFPRRRLLVLSEAACAGTVTGALAGVALGSRPTVYACVGLCGLLSMVSTVSGNALIPMVVAADELPAANGIHAVGQEAAMACGALLGGLTLAIGGASVALAFNLASYAVSILLYMRITVDDQAASRPPGTRGGFTSGLRYILARRALAVVVGAFALATVATSLVNATLPKFTTNLGLGAGGYGFALAALAGGMIVGEAVAGAFATRMDARSLALCLGAMAALFAALAFAGSGPAALLLLACVGIANGGAEVVMMTAIHQDAEPEYHGRVFGVGATLWRTTMLGAVALAPLINAAASPSEAIALAAACLLITAVGVQATVRRNPTVAPTAATA